MTMSGDAAPAGGTETTRDAPKTIDAARARRNRILEVLPEMTSELVGNSERRRRRSRSRRATGAALFQVSVPMSRVTSGFRLGVEETFDDLARSTGDAPVVLPELHGAEAERPSQAAQRGRL